MKRSILYFVKPVFWKSYYFKTFILYSAFMLTVVMSYSFFLTNYMNNNLEKEIHKSNKALLTQVQIFSDTYLIGKVNSLLSEKFLDISKDKNIHDFFFSAGNMGSVFPMYQSITDILINNKYLDSIYIYRKNDHAVISSKEGLVFYSDNMAKHDESPINKEFLLKTMNAPENRKWVSPRENSDSGFPRPVISLAQTIPMLSPVDQRLGCIIININEEDFLRSVNKVSDTNSGELMIIDSNGMLFAHNNRTKLYNSAQYVNDIHTLLTGDEGFTTFNHGGNHLGITWIKSSINNWKFVSVVPIQVLNKPLIIVRQVSLLILGVIILISLLGFNVITSWVYKPLNMLIKTTKEKFNIKDTSNELAIINSVITSLSTQVEEMKTTIRKNESLIENKTALEILNGNYAGDNEIYNRLKLIGKEFIFSRYSIVIAEINKKVLLNLQTDTREYIAYKMIELMNAYLNRECVCISICNPFNRIVSIVNHENSLTYLLDLDNLLQILKQELGVTCNIAVSDPASDLATISSIYSSTCDYLKYGFIYGYSNIFTREQIDKFESNSTPTDSITLSHLEALLKSCRILPLKNEIKKNLQLIRENGYSYHYAQNMLLQITNLIYKTAHEQNICTDELEEKRLLSHLNAVEQLEDYIEWLYKLIDIYAYYIEVRNTSIHSEFMFKIKEYIPDNINNQISLNSVAAHFKMNPSHLSTTFKECIGINFSDFVLNKKLEKAADLLVNGYHLEVNEIADSIGYSNTTYFTRLFKEKYGMTPMQYRKKNV